MILPLRVLGSAAGEANVVGHGQRADLPADVLLKLLPQLVAGVAAGGERDEHRHGLALQVVRPADGRGLGHRRVAHQRASISIVLSRWPETFSTSSMRPMIQ